MPLRGAFIFILATAACACGAGEEQPPILPGTLPPPCELTSSAFVIDSIELPSTRDAVDELGFDLDMDPAALPDNSLGFVLLNLHAAFLLDLVVGESAIADGRLLWLIEIQTCETASSPHARVTVHRGRDTDDDPTNNLTGSALLAIETPGGIAAVGQIDDDGRLVAELGEGIAPVTPLFELESSTAVVQWSPTMGLAVEFAENTDGSLSGRLATGLRQEPAVDILAQAIATTLTQIVENDPGCPSSCSDLAAEIALDTFDGNRDGTITKEEVLESAFAPVAPDVDLTAEFEQETVYWPRHDGQYDHLSLGIAIHAVPVLLDDEPR